MSDTQRDREERQHVIEVLKSWDGYFIGYTSDEVQEALRYAIASIETDLRYDLLYEETSGQADKQVDKPTTKNDCENCIHNKGVLECDMYGCKYESTTKENLAVDAVSRQALIDWLKNCTIGDASPLIDFVNSMPPVTPQLSSGLEKNSKKLEKDFGESDCISRQATVKRLCNLAEFMNEHKEESSAPYIMAALFIQDNETEFPSVTPQEPKSEWEHDHEILRAYADGANNVLDKLRAEIDKLYEREGSSFDRLNALDELKEFIDKYKAETENP